MAIKDSLKKLLPAALRKRFGMARHKKHGHTHRKHKR